MGEQNCLVCSWAWVSQWERENLVPRQNTAWGYRKEPGTNISRLQPCYNPPGLISSVVAMTNKSIEIPKQIGAEHEYELAWNGFQKQRRFRPCLYNPPPISVEKPPYSKTMLCKPSQCLSLVFICAAVTSPFQHAFLSIGKLTFKHKSLIKQQKCISVAILTLGGKMALFPVMSILVIQICKFYHHYRSEIPKLWDTYHSGGPGYSWIFSSRIPSFSQKISWNLLKLQVIDKNLVCLHFLLNGVIICLDWPIY